MNSLKPRGLKFDARRLLAGKFSFTTLAMLTTAAISLVLEYLMLFAFPSISGIFQYLLYLACYLLVTIIANVLQAGLYGIYLNITQYRTYKVKDVFAAFRNHPEPIAIYTVMEFAVTFACMLAAQLLLKSSLPLAASAALILVLLAALLWFTLTFAPVYFLHACHPQRPTKELLAECLDLMKGKRLRFLWLRLTFAGVLLLGILSFGFGLLYALPYLQVTEVLFYLRLLEER